MLLPQGAILCEKRAIKIPCKAAMILIKWERAPLIRPIIRMDCLELFMVFVFGVLFYE